MKQSFFLLLAVSILGCADDGVSVPPSIPLNQLLAAPDTIQVEGRTLYLTTSLNRDFMPVTPPDGDPLVAAVYITATDTVMLSPSVSADAIWIVYEDQIWSAWLVEGISSHFPQQNRIMKIARNGPKWGPNVYVTVVVRVKDSSGNSFHLRASDQWIGSTA